MTSTCSTGPACIAIRGRPSSLSAHSLDLRLSRFFRHEVRPGEGEAVLPLGAVVAGVVHRPSDRHELKLIDACGLEN